MNESSAVTLKLNPMLELTEDQFYELCRQNPNLKFEQTATGELVIMPPTGWETGNRNSKLTTRLGNWTDSDGTGMAFDSNTGFTLPSGAIRSPDAAWVLRSRIDAINPNPAKFLPLAPDFVVELMSASDETEEVRAKMREYRDNGVRLGWLLSPKHKIVEIYRLERPVETLFSPVSLSGEDVLPGFVLNLSGILS